MRRVSSIVVVGAIALAGCGSSSKTASTSTEPSLASFKTAFAAEKVKLRSLGRDTGAAVVGASSKTDAALMTQFEGLASRATAVAGELGQLSAPSIYKGELSSLQSIITQIAGTLHSIEAAAAAHDADAAKAASETLVADAKQATSIDKALSTKLGLPTLP